MDATEAADFARAWKAAHVPYAIDVERLLGIMQASLDCAYVRAALVEVVGEDDFRTRKWDELVKQLVAT